MKRQRLTPMTKLTNMMSSKRRLGEGVYVCVICFLVSQPPQQSLRRMYEDSVSKGMTRFGRSK